MDTETINLLHDMQQQYTTMCKTLQEQIIELRKTLDRLDKFTVYLDSSKKDVNCTEVY